LGLKEKKREDSFVSNEGDCRENLDGVRQITVKDMGGGRTAARPLAADRELTVGDKK